MTKKKPTKQKPAKKKTANKKRASKKRLRTVPEAIALLDNPEFVEDAYKVFELSLMWTASKYAGEEWKIPESQLSDEERVQFEEISRAFIQKWWVFPPPFPELLNLFPKWHQTNAIMTGNWGIIPVFPWTREDEIKEEARRIRRAIGKRHRDAMDNERRRTIALWLWLHRNPDGSQMFSNSDIARYVLEKKSGLRRPTTAEAIGRLDPEREEVLLRKFKQICMEEGIEADESYQKAQRRVYRHARGSEAPAAAAVRQALQRDSERREALFKDSEKPQPHDPISYAITMLIRAITYGPKDEEELIQCLSALNEAILDYPTVI